MNTSSIRRFFTLLFAQWFQTRANMQWLKPNSTKVLIETWPGFTKADWIKSLDLYFPGWENQIEARFVSSRLERLMLSSDMEVYASTWLDADLIAQASHLRWVYLAVGGQEFIEGLKLPSDLKITTAAGISAPGIAEHVLGLMLALSRRFDIAIKQQIFWQWCQDKILPGIRLLRGQTAGILGLGHNGQAIAKLLKSIGMQVIGFDIRTDLNLESINEIYTTPEDFNLFLSKSDFVVVCVPLTNQTRGLINQSTIKNMKKSGFLVNVTRGEVVNEADLAYCLHHNVITGAALDVLSSEPPPFFSPLRRCINLIITPHVAGNIFNFRHEIIRRFVTDLKTYQEKEKIEGFD
jgi:phosphoglycerate dehydrogenase-like enzyme